MSCEKMESRILGYVDGRLKESERPDVEKHLAAVRAVPFACGGISRGGGSAGGAAGDRTFAGIRCAGARTGGGRAGEDELVGVADGFAAGGVCGIGAAGGGAVVWVSHGVGAPRRYRWTMRR